MNMVEEAARRFSMPWNVRSALRTVACSS
jgi:hypothetical protein